MSGEPSGDFGMRSSVETFRRRSREHPARETDAPLLLREPAEDPLAPARGILIACCLSLALWLGAIALFL